MDEYSMNKAVEGLEQVQAAILDRLCDAVKEDEFLVADKCLDTLERLGLI